MAVLPILIAAAVPVAVAVLVKAVGGDPTEEERVRGLLDAAPLSTVAALREGDVAKVRGRVEAFGEPLVAPFSAQPSVSYDVRGVAWSEAGQSVIGHGLESETVDFWVNDGTGRLLVRAGPFTRLVLEEQFSGVEMREEREAFEARYAQVLEGRDIHYALVASLDVGEEVVVCGKIGFDPSVRGVTRGYRDAVGVPELVLDSEVERIVSDHPALLL